MYLHEHFFISSFFISCRAIIPPIIVAVAAVNPTGDANNPVAIPTYFGEVLRNASNIT